MFDGLRGDSSNSSFEEPVEYFPDDSSSHSPTPDKRQPAKRKPVGKIFGMNAQQRFIIAVMLMFAVCTLGSMCMLVTGKFILP